MSILQLLTSRTGLTARTLIAYQPASYSFSIDNGDEIVYVNYNSDATPASYSFSIDNGDEIVYVSDNIVTPALYTFNMTGTT